MKIFEFNQGQKGTLIDSVSKTAGTLSAGGFRKTEKGSALYCDGSSVKVSYPASTPLSLDSNVFSIEGYFKIDSPTTWATIFDNRDDNDVGVEIICTTQKKLSLRINNFDVDGATTLVDNKYYHFVATYNGSVGNLYLNNNLDRTLTKAETIAVNGDIAIGGRAYTTGEMFKGFIGNIKIYDHVLSEQERNTLYQEFLNSSPTEKDIRGFEYPKPTDTSYEDGLVAHYAFSPETVSNGTLIDVSGNGNNGSIVGALLTKEGMSFNGLNNYIQLKTSVLSNIALSLRFKTSSSSRQSIIAGALDGTCVFINNGVIGSGNALLAGMATTKNTYKDGLWHSLTVIKTGANNYRFFIDGVEDSGGSDSGYRAATEFQIGVVNNSSVGVTPTLHFNGEISDIRIYNRELTQAEITAYHNSFVKPVLLEDFSRNPVGNTTLRDWLIPKGGFVVEEEDLETKYIKATSGSAINCAYIQSNLIEGEWQVDLKYTSQPGYIAITSERPETALTNYTGYIVLYNASGNSGNIFIRRYINGTATNLFLGSAGDISANKWWRLRFTKKSCGTINLYAKNLTDNEPWKEITTGTITDTTITKSGYFGLTLVPSGTQIKNIKIYNGVKQ